MIPVRVTVLLHDTVVEDRRVHVVDHTCIGDSPEAEVPFPGADLVLRRVGDRVFVRRCPLEPGVPTQVSLGAVTVLLEAHEPSFPSEFETNTWGWSRPFVDVRVGVLTFALILTSSFVDAAKRFAQNDPLASEYVAEWFDPGWREDAYAAELASVDGSGDMPEGVAPEGAFQPPIVDPWETEVPPAGFVGGLDAE